MTDEELKAYIDERVEKQLDERMSRIAKDVGVDFRISGDAGYAIESLIANIRAALRNKRRSIN